MTLGNKFSVVDRAPNFSLERLQAGFKGQVITPNDSIYDQARTVFYGGIDDHPAVIVRPVDTADVSFVVSFARESGMGLAVRSGGHSMAGHGVLEGGIVLDLSAMKALDIDVEAKTAWAETGLTAGEVTAALAAHGLVVGFGDTGSVGIGGITLGGGVGFLVRKYGLTIDNLLAAEIVTADGQILQVDSSNHADLFWAIRGGGGNFGVVTRFQYQLHEVDSIVGGMLVLPASAENIHAFVAAAEAAPEELSAIANILTAPPMPFLPAEAHGKRILMALMVYAGEAEAGLRAVAPFRAIDTPLADMLRPMRYVEMFPPEEAGYHPLAEGRSLFMDKLETSDAALILEQIAASTGQMAVTQLRVLGGAAARVPADATAYAHRARRLMVNVAALYGNPEEKSVHATWVNHFAAALQQGEADVYVNFLGNEGEARVRAAYPGATWDRLASVKAQYDPTNFFRQNHNIQPKAE